MLACSDVEEGGGALMVLPGSVQLAKAAVAEMRSRLGDEAYHSREWRAEIGKAIAEEHGERGVEVHPRDGDLVIFVRPSPTPCLDAPAKTTKRALCCRSVRRLLLLCVSLCLEHASNPSVGRRTQWRCTRHRRAATDGPDMSGSIPSLTNRRPTSPTRSTNVTKPAHP